MASPLSEINPNNNGAVVQSEDQKRDSGWIFTPSHTAAPANRPS